MGVAVAGRHCHGQGLVRAFGGGRCWTMVHAMLEDLARAKGIALSSVLRLTLLAPDLWRRSLDGRRQLAGLQLDDLLAGIPLGWEKQRTSLLTRV